MFENLSVWNVYGVYNTEFCLYISGCHLASHLVVGLTRVVSRGIKEKLLSFSNFLVTDGETRPTRVRGRPRGALN